MAQHMKRGWLAVLLITWMGPWVAVFLVNRRTFNEADAEFWSVYVEGEWTSAMLAAHEKQVAAYDWAFAGFLLGLIVPLAASIVFGIVKVVSQRARQHPGS